MSNTLLDKINRNINYINEVLEVAEDNSLDHDYAIDCISYASNLNDAWKSVVEKMLKDPSYKPDLSKIDHIEW